MEALIETISPKGFGIAKGPKGKIEIAHTVPGDRVLVDRKRLLEVLTPSDVRVEPKCAHARTCGGCCWQQMAYSAQLQEKESRVRLAFGQEVSPIIACDQPFGYRNKMEFTFSENKAGNRFLGLMIAQAGGYVFNLTECHLTNSWFAETVNSVRAWWETTELKAFFPPAESGSLRYLTLREGMRTGQKMAILNVSGNPDYALNRTQLNGFVEAVKLAAGADAAVFLRIHQTKKGEPTRFYEMHLSGPDHIIEKLQLSKQTLSFKISPVSFFQPNTLSAEKLYDTALSLLPDCDTLFDLYCGTGTLGMAAAIRVKRVIGIELSPEAVLDAEENLARNNISNMTLYQGDVGQVITKLMAETTFTAPDAVIVDPPRAGLDPLAIAHLITLKPKVIVYVSCNPTTQAANVRELIAAGYTLKSLQPLDQFPHTYHIENIALLAHSGRI